jgi:Mn2+/Fe2+ NRAMP family transporter
LAADVAVQERKRPAWVRILSGPGLVFVLAALGPQDLVSNAVAGAEYGYSLLWTLVLLAVARYVVLEASGRYVAVTGESLVEGYSRYGRWMAWLLLLSILLKRHLTNLSLILLLGVSANMLLPLYGNHGVVFWSILLWTLSFWIMWWGRYPRVEKWFRPLGLLLACCLAMVAVLARPDPLLVFHGLAVPSILQGGSLRRTLFLLMALMGAGAGSVNNLKYPAFLLEKRWDKEGYLRANRQQALLSAGGLLVAALLVQVAFAASGQQTQGIQTANDMAAIIGRVLGAPGRLAMSLGLAAAVFSTFVGANTGYSLIASDLYHNVLRRDCGETRKGSPGSLPAYRWALLVFTVPPLYVLFTAWQPIWMVLLSAAMTVVLLPLTVTVLLLLTSDSVRMGEQANGWSIKMTMVFVIVAALYLTWSNAQALLPSGFLPALG